MRSPCGFCQRLVYIERTAWYNLAQRKNNTGRWEQENANDAWRVLKAQARDCAACPELTGRRLRVFTLKWGW